MTVKKQTEFVFLSVHKFKETFVYVFVDRSDKRRKLLFSNGPRMDLFIITHIQMDIINGMLGMEVEPAYSALPLVIYSMAQKLTSLQINHVKYERDYISKEEWALLLREVDLRDQEYVFTFSEN